MLYIIHNSRKRFPVFVFNRVFIIERHTDVSNRKYIPSKINPANITTKPITIEAFLNSKTWSNGPKFLLLSQNNWPEPPPILLDLPSNLSPLSSSSAAKTLATVSKSKPFPIEILINRYPSFDRLKKCVTWLIRCKHFLHLKVKNNDSRFVFSALSIDELQNAELCLIKYIQEREFSAVISFITNGGLLTGSFPRYLLKLKPILVDGVLRVGGKLDKHRSTSLFSIPLYSRAVRPLKSF